MLEAPEPERDALDPLDEVVGCFGGSVGHVGSVPGGDLVAPSDDGAAKLADLGSARLVLEVAAESFDELVGEVGVSDVVDAAHGLLGVPAVANLAVGVAGVEEAQQLLAAVVGRGVRRL